MTANDTERRVPEQKDAPCNICGRGWPYHHDACAYKQTAARLTELERELEQAREALREADRILEWWHGTFEPHTSRSWNYDECEPCRPIREQVRAAPGSEPKVPHAPNPPGSCASGAGSEKQAEYVRLCQAGVAEGEAFRRVFHPGAQSWIEGELDQRSKERE